ncbi:hypothetical protein QJS04_geneDACA022579 [Acorus gramineus]|uniref:Amino acid transporter transmembrane domain-containing protein n=1 Tax=Acorus gramineus TaxID=55184 RepID=A0AAV8ZXG4_ACOGR|nr:hypothetical protein QJS04_geneDACA022579 [Acorus gramineus]
MEHKVWRFTSEQTPLSSNPKTFANIFISTVGAGVLGLHYTFMRTGGSLTITIIAFLTYHYMMLLVLSRCHFESRLDFSKILSFGDLGFIVSGPLATPPSTS